MPRHQAYNAHVSNINTHGSTRFVEHEGRTEFMNCPKNDNYTYDRSLVGNWVEERQNFAADGPLGGTVPLTTAATTETKTIYQQWDPLQNLSRVAQNKTVAQANGYAGQVGAKATSLPEQARHGWAGTQALEEQVNAPKKSGAEVFGTTMSPSGGPWVSSYQLGCAQGLQERSPRSWNRHILNYEDQFNNGPEVATKLSIPKLGTKFNPYLSTARRDYRTPTGTSDKRVNVRTPIQEGNGLVGAVEGGVAGQSAPHYGHGHEEKDTLGHMDMALIPAQAAV